MAAPTVADQLLERLRGWGVDTVFGYAGDGINGLLAAWGRSADGPRFVQTCTMTPRWRTGTGVAGYAISTGQLALLDIALGLRVLQWLRARVR